MTVGFTLGGVFRFSSLAKKRQPSAVPHLTLCVAAPKALYSQPSLVAVKKAQEPEVSPGVSMQASFSSVGKSLILQTKPTGYF